jgi:general secretion pathway protein N
MSTRRSLWIAVAASFALPGNGAAQMRVAVTTPTNPPEAVESPLTTAPGPSRGNVLQPGPSARGGRTRAAAASEPRGNPLWAIPLKSLSFTRERPLFTPSRRPPTPPVAYSEPARPVVAAKPTEPETPRLALIGLVVGDKDGIAIFVDQNTREVVRLRKNEGHSGWILISIQGREAILEKAPFTATLVIPPPGAEQSPGTPGQSGTLPGLKEPEL